MKHDLRYGGTLAGKAERNAIIKSIDKSIKSGNWQTGPEAKKMEAEASKFLGVKYGILTTSGSCAGLLALSALELPRGSEVIISAVTFPTIFNIILQCGLVPVVVDAKIGTYNFDIDEVEQAIIKSKGRVKCVIAVHAVGNPVDWIKLQKVAKKHKVITILDNCDGFSTTINGKAVETYADISFTSTHGAHIISTAGTGGIVFTNNKIWPGLVRQYRDWGRVADTTKPHNCPTLPKDQNPRFVYDKIGYNFQMLELQAAMGRVQLRKSNKIRLARMKNFMYLYTRLMDIEDLIMPTWLDDANVCWFSFPLSTKGDRGKLVKHLEKHGIETRSMFSGNIIKHPAYKKTKYKVSGKLVEANWILEHSFWITCHPRLKKTDLDYIIKVFKDYYKC